jgi:hypothetical protein
MSTTAPLPAAMFPWIFRKDLRLLWPLAIASACGQVLLSLLRFHWQPYSLGEHNSAVAAVVTLGLVISMVLLIVLAVQQDAIPGVTQDWLVRPIRRRDLLLGKALTVVLLIHGPIFVAKLLQGLAEGLPFWQLLPAVLLSNFEVALVFSLPIMAIAALTRSVAEAVVVALAVALGLLLSRLLILGIAFPFTHSFQFFESQPDTGVDWVWRCVSHVLLLTVLMVVLLLQYFRRATLESRGLFFVGMLLFMMIPELPWKPAFAIQQWFAADGAAGLPVAIAFDTSSGRPTRANAIRLDNEVLIPEQDEKKKNAAAAEGFVQIALPLQISGVPSEMILHADRSAVRLIGESGRTVFQGVAHVFDARSSGEIDSSARLDQTILIPERIYQEAAAQALRLEVDYSLTLMRPRVPQSFAAVEGPERVTDVGQCASRADSGGMGLEVACRTAGSVPPCVSVALEQATGARRSPERFVCDLNYEPASLRFSVEPIDQFQVKLPLPEPGGRAQVILRQYEPADHFSRELVVSRFRLADWRIPP